MLLTASLRGWYVGELALVVESERESAEVHTLAKDVADAQCDNKYASRCPESPKAPTISGKLTG